jgi:hypothetical protein
MGREADVAREEPRLNWWDGSSQNRMLELKKDQPTTYRITGYEIKPPSESEVREALDSVEKEALVVELPPEREEFEEIKAHEATVIDGGHLVIRKIVGVGSNAAGWENVAIFPPGTWKKCEAIKYREG